VGSNPITSANKKKIMDTNLQGNIGESKAVTYFIANGYNVYLPFGTASSNDMIIKRVSVKTTKTRTRCVNETKKYIVKIRQGKLNSQIPFNNQGSDILCVYILPEDKIVLLISNEITAKYEITVS
jgi:hypothetical protein